MAGPLQYASRALGKERRGGKVPPDVEAKLKRAKQGLDEVAPRRKEAIAFARNEHYVSIDKGGTKLIRQSTVPVSDGGTKPNHRVRISNDILSPILQGKRSAATQRIPGYEVLPATMDPEDYTAARIAKNVAVAGYDIWKFKEGFRRGTWDAFVTEEAFFVPVWDAERGPFMEVPSEEEDGEPTVIGMGEVKLEVYSGLQVSWEPGVEYNDAPYYVIEEARAVESVEQQRGFIGKKLTADADAGDGKGPKKSKGSHMVMVTEFLERPCSKYPRGRRLIFANGQEIFPEEDYPLQDAEGEVVDAPYLHRLAYNVEGESERAHGLVQSLIETVRLFDYASNKAAEFLQLCLVPQMIAPEGAVKGVITDEPGAVIEVDEQVLQAGNIQWREMPSMPREFDNERERAMTQLGFIANNSPIPARMESAKAVEAIASKDILAWEDFIEDLAEVHAGVMRDALVLVQRFYTEERMLKFRGRTGWEQILDFRGADIRGQTDVRVRPGSLEPLTQAMIEQKIMNVATLAQGSIPPEVVIAALSSSNIDKLNEFYEEDEAQANFIIAQIRAGTFKDLPDRPVFKGEEAPALDPETGAIAEWEEEPSWELEPERDEGGKPVPGTGKLVPGTGRPVMQKTVPGWMPRPFDGVPLIKHRVEVFMKSDEWRHLDEEAQEATLIYYDALQRLEAQQAARKAQVQSQEAARLGMENAAAPQPPGQGTPSLPALAAGEAQQ